MFPPFAAYTRQLVAVAIATIVSPPPAVQQDCVEFRSPGKLQAGSSFQTPLQKGLEFHLSNDWDISIRPVSENTDYLWLVSPPLQTAPQRKFGGGYGLTAEDSAKIRRALRFVLNRSDYDAARAAIDLEPGDLLKRLDELGRGVLLLYVDKYELQGSDFKWISFHGEACVPR